VRHAISFCRASDGTARVSLRKHHTLGNGHSCHPSLRVDPDGNLLVQPVIGWAVAAAEPTSVAFLVLEYLDHPEQLKTGDRWQLHATLSPRQAMEIAATLIQAAGTVLEPPSGLREARLQ